MTEPTDRQLAILRVIAGQVTQGLPPPTFREIGAAVGIRSTNGVRDHLDRLAKKGLIHVGSGFKTRQIQITELGKKLAGVFYDPRPGLLEDLYRTCIAFGNGDAGKQVVLDATDVIRQHDGQATRSRPGVRTFDSCGEHQAAAPLSVVGAEPRHSSGAP